MTVQTKIVAGILKNRPLKGVGSGVRPMTAYMRKRMFDKISDFIIGKNVLDLFSGSGAIGFEALSRGCSRVVFVENDSKRAVYISEISKKWKIEDRIKVFKSDVLSFSCGERFNPIFVDPPYAFEKIGELALKIIQFSETGAKVIWHTNRDLYLPDSFVLDDFVETGGKKLFFFEIQNAEK
ncbi:RsmD family RNA methyltransferase [candidate division WOR-3 bacterium]|nr:RsmD family RNA methyltransferase [candidate division WOR-3 bacterium]